MEKPDNLPVANRKSEIEAEQKFWNSVGKPLGWTLIAHSYCEVADFRDAEGTGFEITGSVRNQIAELQSLAQGERRETPQAKTEERP